MSSTVSLRRTPSYTAPVSLTTQFSYLNGALYSVVTFLLDCFGPKPKTAEIMMIPNYYNLAIFLSKHSHNCENRKTNETIFRHIHISILSIPEEIKIVTFLYNIKIMTKKEKRNVCEQFANCNYTSRYYVHYNLFTESL